MKLSIFVETSCSIPVRQAQGKRELRGKRTCYYPGHRRRPERSRRSKQRTQRNNR